MRVVEHLALQLQAEIDAQAPRPIPFLILKITGACNARCKTCNVGIPGMAPPAQMLPVHVAKDVLDRMAARGTLFVGLVGGEPLLHRGVFDIIAHCTSLGLRTNLNSHGGLITESVAVKLAEAGLSYLSLSLDSPNPERNDAIRVGIPFTSAVAGLRNVKRHSPNTRRAIGMTITRNNLDEMVAMCHFAKQEDIRFLKFQPFHAHLDQGVDGDDPRMADMVLRRDDWPRLKTALTKAKAEADKLGLITNARMMLAELGAAITGTRTLPCVAGSKIVYVSPTGHVGGCPEKVSTRSLANHKINELLALESERFELAHTCPKLPTCFDTTYGESSHLLNRRGIDHALDLFERTLFYA